MYVLNFFGNIVVFPVKATGQRVLTFHVCLSPILKSDILNIVTKIITETHVEFFS